MTSWLGEDELRAMGFRALGAGVKLSRRAAVYQPGRIAIGDHSRIDDFCVLSAGEGGITIGRYVHLAVYVSLIGAGRVEIGDYSTLSSRVAVYTSNDDYSGESLTGPPIPDRYRRVAVAPVTVGRHCVVGAGSVVLPGVTLAEGCAIGALSLVKEDCGPFTIYAGSPLRQLGPRRRTMLDLEAEWEASADPP